MHSDDDRLRATGYWYKNLNETWQIDPELLLHGIQMTVKREINSSTVNYWGLTVMTEKTEQSMQQQQQQKRKKKKKG
ncbi:hypothetical protein AKJ16_DCAP12269 [Drosera capensis]